MYSTVAVHVRCKKLPTQFKRVSDQSRKRVKSMSECKYFLEMANKFKTKKKTGHCVRVDGAVDI